MAGKGEPPGICVCEFEECIEMGQSKVSYHLRKLKEAGLVREERRGKWSFYSLDREAAVGLFIETEGYLGATTEGSEGARTAGPRRRLVFLCTHNSARSRMVGGLLRHLAGDRFEVMSARTEVTSVRPEATRAMAGLGVDIFGQKSSKKAPERYLGEPFD